VDTVFLTILYARYIRRHTARSAHQQQNHVIRALCTRTTSWSENFFQCTTSWRCSYARARSL